LRRKGGGNPVRTTPLITACLLLGLALGAHATGDDQNALPGEDILHGTGTLDEEEEARFECIHASTLDQILDAQLPPTHICGHGRYIRTDGPHGFSHGFSDLPYEENGWTGFVESWLQWAGQDRGFRCEFQDGELGDCEALGGVFPPIGQPYWQECRAYTETPLGLVEIAQTEFGCMNRGDVERYP
jgi:hypothetical protein